VPAGAIGVTSGGSIWTASIVGTVTIETVSSRFGLQPPERQPAASAPTTAQRRREALTT
jgi:hypothetical protein